MLITMNKLTKRDTLAKNKALSKNSEGPGNPLPSDKKSDEPLSQEGSFDAELENEDDREEEEDSEDKNFYGDIKKNDGEGS